VYVDPDPSHGHQKEFVFFFDRESVQPSDANYLLPGENGRANLSDSANVFTSCGVGDPNSECLRVVAITGDVSIVKTCVGTMLDCTNLPSTYGLGNTSLVFTRPFSEAVALRNALGIGDYTGSSFQVNGDVRIRLMSDTTGRMRDIVVTPLGQIHIEAVE
jgi:hypothetical protein